MYELIKLTEKDHFIDCPAKIGLVLTGENEAVLIDSGSDKDTGKKALKILDANGWKLKAVYATHSHADHIGGCRLLQDRTGCAVYAAGLEAVYSENTLLEPAGLYGGRPFKDLKHKFLMAQECKVQQLTEAVLPEGWALLDLPGHSQDMKGFVTADGTAYIADSVVSEETIAKYGITYLWDPEQTKASLEKLKSVQAMRFVPAHAPVTEDIKDLADMNIKAIGEVENMLMGFCSEPASFEGLLKKVFDTCGMMMTAQQYVLIGSTVRSYLSSLCDGGLLKFEFTENMMLWSRI